MTDPIAIPNVILVQPKPGESRCATSMAVWYTIAKSMKLSHTRFTVADSRNWSTFLSSDVKNCIILSSPSSIPEVVSSTNGTDFELSIVIIPRQFANWGAEPWVSIIESAPLSRIRIFTDSEGSRRSIESNLANARHEVRVIKPDFGLLAGAVSTLEEDSVREMRDRLKLLDGTVSETAWNFSEYKVASEMNVPFARSENCRWHEFDQADYVRDGSEINSMADIGALEERLSTFELSPDANSHNVAEASRLGRPYDIDLSSTKVGVFGNKLTFIDELARAIEQRTGASVRLDPWKYLSGPPHPKRSEQLIEESDVIIGEWARPNNVWIQERAKPDKRLIVRAHRYEVTTEFPRKIDMDRFDASVVIVPWVGRALVQDFDWPEEKMVYIPNYINRDYFSRPKLPDARFTLGIVGITPSLKRVDLALDLLAAVREIDTRYILRIRGNIPTEHINWKADPRIASQWGESLARIELDPRLRGAVHFDKPGRDMSAWFQKVGIVLSTSDVEGSHVALAEGIASGALPVARRWPGIDTLWPDDFVFDHFGDAVDWILKTRDEDWFRAQVGRFEKHQSLDSGEILRAWGLLISGSIRAAQRVFGDIDWRAPIYTPIEQRNSFC